jgi:hypothetical protein
LRDPCALDASSYTETENILSEGIMEADFFAGKGIEKTGDKVLNTKSNEEIKKILESFQETQPALAG